MESQFKRVKTKRQRSENWLEGDKMILKELVNERVAVIENKNTDSNTNEKKIAAWNDLHTSFNLMAHTPRTLTQIKAQWCIQKMLAKKKKFLERKKRLQTCGSSPATDPLNSDDTADTVDTNESDSDSQMFTDNKSTVRILRESPEQEIEMETSKQSDPPKINGTATKNKLSGLNNKQITKHSTDAAMKLVEIETACRRELHVLHMANEKQKMKNLLLKQEVLKAKLYYYQNKT